MPFVKITQSWIEGGRYDHSKPAYFYGDAMIKPPYTSATQYGKPDQWLVTALFKDRTVRETTLEFKGECLFANVGASSIGHTMLIPAEELEIDPKTLRYAHDVEALKIAYDAELDAKKQAAQKARDLAELVRLKAQYEP